MSGYAVKTVYLTIQGEGAHTGRRAVFLRFTGCNLWTGREKDRPAAICRFCDTDFLGTDGPGGGVFSKATDLAAHVARSWEATDLAEPANERPYVVCTGGEPLLQLDDELIDALHADGFEIGVETNGTRHAPQGIDWLSVSPKAGAALAQTCGDELKVVWPQADLDLEALLHLDFRHFYLQPMDGDDLEENTHAVVEYCRTHPGWRVSIQLHKVLGVA